jgi:hypothetical protein
MLINRKQGWYTTLFFCLIGLSACFIALFLLTFVFYILDKTLWPNNPLKNNVRFV